jgi:hypothetical protein
MISGFNTNVRHRGVVFHVQTEDSGRAHPHVITHLYQGGTILASEKRGYADRVADRDLASIVKALMEAQHGAMVDRLRKGELDGIIAERLGAGVFGDARESTGTSGHTQPAVQPRAAAPAPRRAAPQGPAEPPLDELILDYLVEATRKQRPNRRAESE